MRTTTLPRKSARLLLWVLLPSTGRAWRASGAGGNVPWATWASIDDVSFCLETPKVSRASTATAATAISPGRMNRRIRP